VLTVPVVLLAMVPAWQFTNWQWLSLALAAFGWSLWALFFGAAGEPGMTHPFRFAIERGAGADAKGLGEYLRSRTVSVPGGLVR
jgi:Cu+-exporting ATPase